MMDRRRPRSARRGFTLIEIVVVLAIAGLAAGLAAPAMVRSVEARRLAAQAEGLADLLKQAGYQAVLQGRPIGLAVDRSEGVVRAARLARQWAIPDGHVLVFPGEERPRGRFRRWLLFEAGGGARGGSIYLCRQKGRCWEIGADAHGQVRYAPSDKAAPA